MAPTDCQNHDTQVMNNNIHNGLYQTTIIPYKTELDVLPPSKPLLVLVTLGIWKIAYFQKPVAGIAHLFILHHLGGHGAQSELIWPRYGLWTKPAHRFLDNADHIHAVSGSVSRINHLVISACHNRVYNTLSIPMTDNWPLGISCRKT